MIDRAFSGIWAGGALAFALVSAFAVYAQEAKPEKFYYERDCDGPSDHRLVDGSRVDCLSHNGMWAIEYEFAPKFKEAIGQALHYARVTGREPGIVIILRSPSDWRYVAALEADLRHAGLGVKVWVVEE